MTNIYMKRIVGGCVLDFSIPRENILGYHLSSKEEHDDFLLSFGYLVDNGPINRVADGLTDEVVMTVTQIGVRSQSDVLYHEEDEDNDLARTKLIRSDSINLFLVSVDGSNFSRSFGVRIVSTSAPQNDDSELVM